ncbi:MAG: hypothetical protein ACKVVP_10570 [Chloroflexota bacterium]
MQFQPHKQQFRTTLAPGQHDHHGTAHVSPEEAASNPFFDHPILNSPYDYPNRHWELDETGQSTYRIY